MSTAIDTLVTRAQEALTEYADFTQEQVDNFVRDINETCSAKWEVFRVPSLEKAQVPKAAGASGTGNASAAGAAGAGSEHGWWSYWSAPKEELDIWSLVPAPSIEGIEHNNVAWHKFGRVREP